MMFTLIINKEKDEGVVATVHERSALTDKIEARKRATCNDYALCDIIDI